MDASSPFPTLYKSWGNPGSAIHMPPIPPTPPTHPGTATHTVPGLLGAGVHPEIPGQILGPLRMPRPSQDGPSSTPPQTLPSSVITERVRKRREAAETTRQRGGRTALYVTLRVLRVKISLRACGPSRSLRRVRSSPNQLQNAPEAAPCSPCATWTTCRAENPVSTDTAALNGSSAGARSFAGDTVAFDDKM